MTTNAPVTFHSSEANILISGSQDGTIKCFDTHCDKTIYTFYSNSESFTSKSGEKCLLQFTAHSGPIYTCDWHSTNNWLATGSRDKQIKVLFEVWNMDVKNSLEYTIHTIYNKSNIN
uniref:GATOR2 complex protein WDR24 n=1 Tax=Glossina austeni TaxID=7395 RepID=A0A1A9V123_GLOAU